MSDYHVSIDPGVHFGEPCLAGRRLTTELIAKAWRNGMSIEDIADNWEIERGDILVACWYQARYGSWTWRKRWADWLAMANGELWHGRYDTCPMPPQGGRGE